MKSLQSLTWILWSTEYWFKALKCHIWFKNAKPFFSESKTNIETLQKFSPYNWVFHKLLLMSVKNLNGILWAVEYSFQASKYQIWLTNTKLFFWESQANLKTLLKLSPYIWIFYNFVLKSVKNLNGIFRAKKFWFKALTCQIWLGNKKPFIWESEANSETLQDFSPDISVSYKVVLKSLKNLNRILWVTEYWFKALKCQIWLTNAKPFFWESEASIVTF